MKVLVCALLLTTITSVVHASSYQKTRFGASVNFGNLSVEDPNGESESKSELFISGIMTLPMDRNYPEWRYWFDATYKSFELAPSISNIGQQVSSFSISAVAQRGLNVSSEFRPWLGIGLNLSLDDYENRFLVARDGFISERFSNRSETNLGIVFNVGISLYPLKNGLYFGSSFSVFSPFENGINSTQLNIFFLL